MKATMTLILTGLLVFGVSALPSGCGKKEVPKEIKRKGLYLKLVVEDNTRSKKPSKEFGVKAAGIDLWIPDLSTRENATLIGPIPLDKQQVLEIYPQGQFKDKHDAIFIANKEMKKESDEDAIKVEVFDDRYVVSGTPVEGGSQEFTR